MERTDTDCKAATRDRDLIDSWCVETWKLVNPTKAASTWFSLKNNIVHSLTPSVSMLGVSIERSLTMECLGALSVRACVFKEHVDYIIVKARKARRWGW